MNLTLYLTENCNLRCSYCIREKRSLHMTKEIVEKSVELAFSSGELAGLCFFGGEPLLQKDLIYYALELSRKKEKETGIPFAAKITTNGTLLDEEFLKVSAKEKMQIGFSFDGLMQDDCRLTKNGEPTFDIMIEKAGLLQKINPDNIAMSVVAPDTCGKLFESVKLIHDLGFKQMICNPAYGDKVTWTDGALEELKRQYALITEYLKGLYINGDSFRYVPICNKISEMIKGSDNSRYCHLGVRQLAVSYDGYLYPCTSFLHKPDWCLGNVFDGIDEEKRRNMAGRCFVPEPCKKCDLVKRCTNSCGCANMMNTGSPDMIAPAQCEYERLLISTADQLGDELYALDKDRFVSFFAR